LQELTPAKLAAPLQLLDESMAKFDALAPVMVMPEMFNVAPAAVCDSVVVICAVAPAAVLGKPSGAGSKVAMGVAAAAIPAPVKGIS
jgi:hypothetical protein